jgi:hypothetical protein
MAFTGIHQLLFRQLLYRFIEETYCTQPFQPGLGMTRVRSNMQKYGITHIKYRKYATFGDINAHLLIYSMV